MKIEINKSYINGEGKVVTITRKRDHSVYPFEDSEGNTYTPSGRYSSWDGSSNNLLYEVSSPQQPIKGQSILGCPNKGTPHKHAELIKAWADGAEIEYEYKGKWYDTQNPFLSEPFKYRIKPKVPKTYIRYGKLEGNHGVSYWRDEQFSSSNLKAEFCYYTHKLLSIEMINKDKQ